MKHNRSNAVTHLGHANGVVTLWSPAAGKNLVSMFCHKSPVSDLAIDREGRYMATTGMDGFMKVWDLRKYSLLHAFKLERPAVSVDISDTGLIALGIGRTAQVLKDAFTRPTGITYLTHEVRTPSAALASGASAVASKMNSLASSISVATVQFRPLEDVLCIGHSHGISSIVVPGSGEPNFDSFENNPFANPKQRREAEVQSLLNKLSHETIGLDASFVGSVDVDQKALEAEHREIFRNANQKVLKKDNNKMRGRNKISAKLRRKQKNVIDAQSVKMREKLNESRERRDGDDRSETQKIREEFGALSRFAKKEKG